jgi:hypothetical protein
MLGDEISSSDEPSMPRPIGSVTALRRSFLQPPGPGGGAGPLARFARARRSLALDLFLVALATLQETGAPASASGAEWLAATGRPPSRSLAASVTRAWNWLESEHLIRTTTEGGRRTIEALREDGTGADWTPPTGGVDIAVELPAAYFEVAFRRPISLHAKVSLLIAVSLQTPGKDKYFELPIERGASWYGLPPGTLRRGLQELRDLGVIHMWVVEMPSANSRIRVRYDRRYRLVDLPLVAWRIRQQSDRPATPAE